MKEITILTIVKVTILMILSNYVYAYYRGKDYKNAAERSYFQFVLSILIISTAW